VTIFTPARGPADVGPRHNVPVSEDLIEAEATSPGSPVDPGADVFAQWSPPAGNRERALVLAGGGTIGIAWESGLVAGLRDEGVDIRDADTMIGTSAGSIVAAHLRVRADEADAFARIRTAAPLAYGRLGPADATRYVRAQLAGDPRRGRATIGRAALTATTLAEDDWIAAVGSGLADEPWPEPGLWITAVDAQTGTSVVFDRGSGVPLDLAVAASCAVPGVFPAVDIGGRHYVDGGLRSVANADLAAGHARVLVLAPYPVGSHLRDVPAVQVRALRRTSRARLIVPDRRDLRAMGANPLDTRRAASAFDTGRAHGRRIADRVGEFWMS
jgi:NTE family protein